MIANKKAKIVMITMFKNEATVLKRMLDSCLPFVDYYVMQNNGSTDGSDEIARKFLQENGLSGEIYFCEEGWKGFGWNRDHLIQYCQNESNHGCDWIMKMDCDERLEVDDNFDWSLLDNKDIQAFHIAAVQGSAIYQRAWMYNAKLPWRFNHDPCHETVYCDIPEIGEKFQIFDLPKEFRHIGSNQGQSWADPLKFILHSLQLEEKMIREKNMLTNLYHFWYIGKSYFDAYKSDAFPLGEDHQKEYARRCIFYFKQHLNVKHNFGETKVAKHIDEMCYLSLIFIGECYEFLGDRSNAKESYTLAESFAPGRNDHLISLAMLSEKMEDYEGMLSYATIMMQENRKFPYPTFSCFIDASMYYDTGGTPKYLFDKANEYVTRQEKKVNPLRFGFNRPHTNRLFVVDNFYSNPDQVREYALQQEFQKDLRWYKGLRTTTTYRPEGIKDAFEYIMGRKINDFESGYNGCFQICTADDPQVYHYDTQRWAAMIYLTPNAPFESGTRLHRSKLNGARHSSDENANQAFAGGFYDSTKFDVIDSVGNVYNRLIIMDAGCIHSAGPYFGTNMQDGRLTHLFFFD
jgi:glycosyltransferase involved in cell wall biosynthesis